VGGLRMAALCRLGAGLLALGDRHTAASSHLGAGLLAWGDHRMGAGNHLDAGHLAWNRLVLDGLHMVALYHLALGGLRMVAVCRLGAGRLAWSLLALGGIPVVDGLVAPGLGCLRRVHLFLLFDLSEVLCLMVRLP